MTASGAALSAGSARASAKAGAHFGCWLKRRPEPGCQTNFSIVIENEEVIMGPLVALWEAAKPVQAAQ